MRLPCGAQVGPEVALALRDASGSGGVVVGGVAGSCDVGWVGWESEVVEDVTDELGIADVRENGAGTSAGTGEDVVEVDALDKRRHYVDVTIRSSGEVSDVSLQG